MEKRKGLRSFENPSVARLILFLLVTLCASSGCGAPGEPRPPSPPIPAAITDLAAHQQGNGVQLVFTLPGRSVNGDRLAEPPAVEIFRGALKPDGKADEKSFRVVYSIPGALVSNYAAQEKIQFTDPISADDLRAHPGIVMAYRVRTRASAKKDSADSNTVTLAAFPVADKIVSVDIKVTQNAIELSWPVPALATANGGASISEYHIYRGELDPSEAVPASGDLSRAKWKNPLLLLAQPENSSYSDTLFEFGKSYVYLVRSVTTAGGNPIESDDSTPVVVTPRDIFPPAAPQNLVAVVLPGENNSRVVDLSWAIGVESDLAGYRIYRSEKQGERGELLQQDLLQSPAYRDFSAKAGQQYWYTVTAVDKAGNESAPSDSVLADLTQPLP